MTMTKEEAIEDLLRHYTGESTDMAIEALKQEPCEDCISREAILLEIEKIKDNYGGLLDVARFIRGLPSVNPKQKGNKMVEKSIIMWQYCNNLNDINTAILHNDRDWEGLHTAEDIISITYNSNHNYYVVSWINRDYTVER